MRQRPPLCILQCLFLQTVLVVTSSSPSEALARYHSEARRHDNDNDNDTSLLHGHLLGNFNCQKVAFYKTYKTGSTDLGAILFRVGVRNGKRFHTGTAKAHIMSAYVKSKPTDFIINHSIHSLRKMQPAYRRYLGGEPGRVTIVRDPVNRYISHFNYYIRVKRKNAMPDGKISGRNRLTADLAGPRAARNATLLKNFFGSEEWRNTVFLRLERLSEGLAALHLHCGWPIKDLLSININCASCGRQLRRTNGQYVPSKFKVSAELRERIAQAHKLDTMLVDAVDSKWREVQDRGGEVLQAVAAEVSRQRSLMEDHCRAEEARVGNGKIWGGQPACIWLSLLDVEYEKTVSPSTGHVYPNTTVPMQKYMHPGIPKMTIEHLASEYDRVYYQVVGGT